MQPLISLPTSQGTTVIADAGGWDHMNGWGWGMAILGWLFMAMIIAVVVWLIRSTTHQRRSSKGHEDRALRVLDQRYARGEIDRDEYLERKTDLEH